MLKKLIAIVLMVGVLGVTGILAGCEKDEIKTHRHVEVKDQVVEQHTVVE